MGVFLNMFNDKSDFLKAMDVLNSDALSATRRPSPKSQSSLYNRAESAFAKHDAEILRKGIAEAKQKYEDAKRLVWEIEHLDPSKLPPGTPTRTEAVRAEYIARKEKERLEQQGEELARQLSAIGDRYQRYSEYDLSGMQYEFYLDKILLPVAPGELSLKIKDKNETIDLASGGEIVLSQKPGLTKISFSVILPSQEYPWAQYKGGYKPPSYFLNALEALKISGKTVDFAVIRNYSKDPDGDTYMRVKLGEYTIKEDAEKLGFDTGVEIELIQDNPVVSHEVRLEKDGKASLVKGRPAGEGKPKVPCTHKVVLGETLTELARYYYGDSKYWINIAKANNKEKNPHTLKDVQYLRIEVIPDA